MLQVNAVPAGTMDILTSLASQPCLHDFRLVGGTSLALQIGHRLSVDLDFFSDQKADLVLIEDELLQLKGIKLKSKSTYALFFEYEGVKVDVLNYSYPFITAPVAEGKITLAHKDDIAAMKLKTVMNRGAKRDFYDIYFLLEEYSFPQMFELFYRKYKNIEPQAILKSLNYFEDAEAEAAPVLLRDKDLSWKKVKQTITNETRKLV